MERRLWRGDSIFIWKALLGVKKKFLMKEHGSSFSNLSESVETPPTTTDPPVILRIEVNNPQNQPYFPSPSCRYCVGGEGVGGEGVGGDGVGGCGKKCTKCEEEACLEIFFPPTSPGLMWLCRNSGSVLKYFFFQFFILFLTPFSCPQIFFFFQIKNPRKRKKEDIKKQHLIAPKIFLFGKKQKKPITFLLFKKMKLK